MNSAVFAGIWTILRSRWQVGRNMFWRGTLARKLRAVALLAVVLAISYGLYRFSAAIVHVLQEPDPYGLRTPAQVAETTRLLTALPSLAFAIATVPLLVSSVSFALAAFYLATDLDLMLVTPVPMRSVFVARFVEGLLPIYGLLLVIILPALAGYGAAQGFGVGYAAALLVTLLLLPLLPMSAGVVLTMLLVRIAPPKRLRELMAVFGGLVGFFVYISTQLITRAGDDFAISETAGRLVWVDAPLLPTTWASRIVFGAGDGNLRVVLAYGLPYLLSSLGFFVVTVLLVERLYYQGWIKVAGTGGGRVRRRAPREQRRLRVRGVAATILWKDLRMLPRDLQRLSQLLVPLALSGFWIWRLLSERSPRGGTVDAGLVAINLFMCLLISANLGLSGVSREGRGYWLLHIAPISPWSILWGKWTFAYVPFLVVGTLSTALIGLLRQPPVEQLLLNWTTIALTGIGVSGIATGLGATFPTFEWTQAQKMTSFRAGCLASIGYYSYTIIMVLLTIGSRSLAGRWGSIVVVGGWSGAVVLTAVALLLPLWIGAIRLRRIEL